MCVGGGVRGLPARALQAPAWLQCGSWPDEGGQRRHDRGAKDVLAPDLGPGLLACAKWGGSIGGSVPVAKPATKSSGGRGFPWREGEAAAV